MATQYKGIWRAIKILMAILKADTTEPADPDTDGHCLKTLVGSGTSELRIYPNRTVGWEGKAWPQIVIYGTDGESHMNLPMKTGCTLFVGIWTNSKNAQPMSDIAEVHTRLLTLLDKPNQGLHNTDGHIYYIKYMGADQDFDNEQERPNEAMQFTLNVGDA